MMFFLTKYQSYSDIQSDIPLTPMSPIPVIQPVPEMTETGVGKKVRSRRASNVSTGRRSRHQSAGAGVGLEGGAGNERVQVIIYNGIKFLFSKSEFKIIRETSKVAI